MKKNKSIPTAIFNDSQNPAELLKNIKNLTVEDVIVLYAYAEAIVETVREPLIILDSDLRIKTANKSFFDKFKVSKEDTYNELIFKVGNGQWNIPKLRKLLIDILPKNSNFNDFEVTHTFDVIGKRTMILNARRIVLEGHKTELILLAIEDITERKQNDQQKDDFIGIISHELKTPLTSIKAFTQILLKRNKKMDDKKNVLMLEKVDIQIDRMDQMIQSFLNVFIIQTGRFILNKEYFILDDLIDEIIQQFKYTNATHDIKRKGKSIKKIYADKAKISQVITNLLTNAIKYSPNANKVNITVRDKDNEVFMSVQDYGMGIPKEQQIMIFERFFRSSEKEKNKIKGLGLGLYIANSIIKAHEGKLSVSSQEGKGSTFYFTLPIKKINKN